MIKVSKADRTTSIAEAVNGGAGYITKEELISREQCGAHCRMFNHISLEPGHEIGYHEHHGETETYYILSGTGLYKEDDAEVTVEAGDITYCASGHGHGLKNVGDDVLNMIALILLED